MIAAIPLGALIGITLGALGGGGSILTVPVLVYLLGQTPHAATTGSLIVVGVTAAAGAALHWREGRVRPVAGLVFGLLGVVGSYVGTRLSAGVDSHVLLSAFAGLMVVAAVAMARRRSGAAAVPAEQPEESVYPMGGGGTAVVALQARGHVTANAVRLLAAATVVGLLTGFFGVGGGFVIVPALVLALGFTMPVAVGTSLLVIAINSAAALLARIGGHLTFDWGLLLVFALAAVGGTLVGNRLASRVRPARLNTAFLWLLLLVAAYTAARNIPHL